MDLEWMAWTLPTAIFFIAIATVLIAMTVWQIASPSVGRRGFLPIDTTPGDRLFIGLLTSAYIQLAWLAMVELSLWWALGLCIAWMLVLMRWG